MILILDCNHGIKYIAWSTANHFLLVIYALGLKHWNLWEHRPFSKKIWCLLCPTGSFPCKLWHMRIPHYIRRIRQGTRMTKDDDDTESVKFSSTLTVMPFGRTLRFRVAWCDFPSDHMRNLWRNRRCPQVKTRLVHANLNSIILISRG